MLRNVLLDATFAVETGVLGCGPDLFQERGKGAQFVSNIVLLSPPHYSLGGREYFRKTVIKIQPRTGSMGWLKPVTLLPEGFGLCLVC